MTAKNAAAAADRKAEVEKKKVERAAAKEKRQADREAKKAERDAKKAERQQERAEKDAKKRVARKADATRLFVGALVGAEFVKKQQGVVITVDTDGQFDQLVAAAMLMGGTLTVNADERTVEFL